MKAVLPVIDERRTTPYYLQIYDYIKDGIIKGEIVEGERLPSLRSLAKTTGLSITTIEQAYNQLLVEGYTYCKAQSGYYVSDVFTHSSRTVHERKPFFEEKLSSNTDEHFLDSSDMHHDPGCFDFNKWKKCMNKILTEYSSTLFFEGESQGEAVLRHEISKYLYMSRGVSCNPDYIFIGAGTQQITSQLSTILRRIGIEHVALENPGYLPVRNIFRDRGFAITEVDVSDRGLAIEKLPTNIRTATYVSPSNNVFTGAVMPIGRRYELLKWANDNNSYIIEDDYDSELRYFGKPIPALKGLDTNDRVIYLGSFSSTLFAAVKISYMVLPAGMAEMFAPMSRDYSQTCSKLEQLTLAMFMKTGNYQTHIKKIRKLYSQKLSLVCDTLENEASDFIEVKNSDSGMRIILNINSNKDTNILKKEAESLGLQISVIDNNLFMLYYNHLPLADIPALMKLLVNLWRS